MSQGTELQATKGYRRGPAQGPPRRASAGQGACYYLCCLICLCGACAPSVAVICKCRLRCQVASSRESPHTDALHLLARNSKTRAVEVKEH